GSSLLVGVAVALRAPVLSSLLARLRRSRPAEPTCAATPRQFRDPGRSLSWVCRSHARDERPRHETQVGMVDAFAACLNLLDGHLSDTSLLCPPNRVKLKQKAQDKVQDVTIPAIGACYISLRHSLHSRWRARRRSYSCPLPSFPPPLVSGGTPAGGGGKRRRGNEAAVPDDRAQRNFSDPDSRIMLGSDKQFLPRPAWTAKVKSS